MLNILFIISDKAILNTLEWTKNLDQIWRQNKLEDEGLTWQYFGSQTGVMRIYPGKSSDIIYRHHFVTVFTFFILIFIFRVVVLLKPVAPSECRL